MDLSGHILHSIVLLLFITLGLVVWFWDQITQKKQFKLKSLTVLIIVIFTVFHLSFLHQVIAKHPDHQTNYHVCCINPTATSPANISFIPPVNRTNFIFISTVKSSVSAFQKIQNKSPPA